jgi:hypothetical protein
MKKIIFTLVLGAVAGFCPPKVWAQGSFLGLRYNEDYRYLANDTLPNWYKKLKYQPLAKSGRAFWSQGGEVRYLAQYFKNEEWGDVPVVDYTAFYTRFLYHADWHLGPRFRLFAQLNSTFANGRVTPNRSIDENRLDLSQAFADWQALAGKHRLTLRLGRQELLYGSQRLVSVREGPNNRQSFDAAKLIYQSGHWQVDGLYAQPVTNRAGMFDDGSSPSRKLWSAYAVGQQVPWVGHIDLYYLGHYHEAARFNGVAGQELRHSLGTRMWGKTARWSYDLEALYQFGRFGEGRIRAYTASTNLSYATGQGRFAPTLGLKTEVISGDRQKTDGVLNTFNPLYPRGAYFGLAALIGPANLVDLHPSIEFPLGKGLVFGIDYDFFWRYSLQDGIYGPNVALIYGDQGSGQAHIGNQLGFTFEYTPTKHLTIVPELTWFAAGPYLRDVSAGQDVLFVAVTAQFKY